MNLLLRRPKIRHKLNGKPFEPSNSTLGGFFLAAFIMVLLLAVFAPAQRSRPARPLPDFADPQLRRAYVDAATEKAAKAKSEAQAWAQKQGVEIRYDDGVHVVELMGFFNGRPMYYATENVNAAISTAADLVRNTAPYDANGAGLTAGIWDGGSALSTHQEFGGRVVVKDGASSNYHSTHVAGTVGAAGVNASALGMAPSVYIDSYDWNSDTGEMASRAMSYPAEPGTIQVSNHSYGFICGWYNSVSPPRWYGQWGNRESDQFGQYNSDAADRDQICYSAP